MSALGHKWTSRSVRTVSDLPPKADIVGGNGDVRFVPEADRAAAIESSFSLTRVSPRTSLQCEARNGSGDFIGDCEHATHINFAQDVGVFARGGARSVQEVRIPDDRQRAGI